MDAEEVADHVVAADDAASEAATATCPSLR